MTATFNCIREGPLPLGLYEVPFQHGIIDPIWPEQPLWSEEEHQVFDPERYEKARGVIDPQEFQTIVTADLTVRSASELRDLLRAISAFAYCEMQRQPSQEHLRPLEYLDKSYRLTITLGLGLPLFVVPPTYRDRLGLADRAPPGLKIMPQLTGDVPNFRPLERQADLILVIASDHPYVNTAAARTFAQYVDRKQQRIRVRSVEQGFSRPDKREFLRFDDGVANISRRLGGELDRLVFVDSDSHHPAWCQFGSYLVYRKIVENLVAWEAKTDRRQGQMIGRRKRDATPLSRDVVPDDRLEPIYPDAADDRDGDLNCHIRKVQPRRTKGSPLNIPDRDRRFLRRGYPFFDGQQDGRFIQGLHFVAYMRDIDAQFEWVSKMWQMNPHFPVPNAGPDTMFASGILSTVDGGYYFCPRAPRNERDFIGSDLFN